MPLGIVAANHRLPSNKKNGLRQVTVNNHNQITARVGGQKKNRPLEEQAETHVFCLVVVGYI